MITWEPCSRAVVRADMAELGMRVPTMRRSFSSFRRTT